MFVQAVAKDEPGGDSASCLWQDKVRGIGFHSQDHVACIVAEDAIRVGREIVH